MKNAKLINLIDYRSLTPEQRSMLVRIMAERARQERSDFIRTGLLQRLDQLVEWALRAFFTPKLPPARSRHG